MDDAQAIRDWFDTWKLATEAGDLKAVLGMYAEDAVFIMPGGETMGREPFAQGVTNSPEAKRDYEFKGGGEIHEIKTFGEYAYLWTKTDFTMTVKATNETTRYAGDSLSILEKRDGRWVLIRDLNNVMPTDA